MLLASVFAIPRLCLLIGFFGCKCFEKNRDIQRPKHFIERLVLLMKTLVPSMTSDEIAAAIAARSEQVGTAPTVAADGELASNFMDPSDLKSLREAHEAQAQRQQEAKKQAEDVALGSKYLEVLGLEAPTKPVQRRVRQHGKSVNKKLPWFEISKGLSFQDFKQVMPKVTGSFLKATPKKRCFTAYYPGAVPASRTRTYGRFSRVAVLKHCVQWAWKWHKKDTGEAPPFTFS